MIFFFRTLCWKNTIQISKIISSFNFIFFFIKNENLSNSTRRSKANPNKIILIKIFYIKRKVWNLYKYVIRPTSIQCLFTLADSDSLSPFDFCSLTKFCCIPKRYLKSHSKQSAASVTLCLSKCRHTNR